MGGDDLGSDDEFLKPSSSGHGGEEDSSEHTDSEGESAEQTNVKRKQQALAVLEPPPSAKRSKKTKNPARLLVETGRNIDRQPTHAQAKFLSTALSHNVLMLDNDATGYNFKAAQFCPPLEDNNASLVNLLKSSLSSMKRLKKHKAVGSPLVIVLCVSARRAVNILKEVASLKVRVAKLFAKHMDIEAQENMLQETAYGLAVGTPHRLYTLATSGNLNLEHTELVVLDGHEDHKGFTVCTLPDTAPHCMKFLHQVVIPQLEAASRQPQVKPLKLAMY